MEATVNVNVTVSLEEATLQKIASIFNRPAGVETRPAHQARPARPAKPAAEEVKPESAPAAKASAPEAAQPIDNMVLMNAVKTAKDAGKTDAIRELFAKYGIASSRDCPQDKRRELLADLNAL